MCIRDSGRLDRAAQEYAALGALQVVGDVRDAVRGRGLPADHVLPGPPRRDGHLQGARRGRQGVVPAAPRQRQRGGQGRRWRRPPLRRVCRPVPQAVLPLRAGGGEAGGHRVDVHHVLGAERAAGGVVGAAQHRPARLGDAGDGPRNSGAILAQFWRNSSETPHARCSRSRTR